MDKIKLVSRFGLDGATLVTDAPRFELEDGWQRGDLPNPAGVLPAGLWGRVPAGDPYLLHVSVLTVHPLAPGDVFELQTGEPTQPRVQYPPTPSNLRLVLVRPSDRLRLLVAPQPDVRVELLIESIGGVNELGARLHAWAEAERSARSSEIRTARFAGAGSIPAWRGVLHVVFDAPATHTLTLPSRATVPLDATLTVTRRQGGIPKIVPHGSDTLAGGQGGVNVTRSVILMNNGDEWTLAGS